MTLASELDRDHACAVMARGSALPPEGLPPPEILDSWVRSMRCGLDMAAAAPIVVVESAELARRRERAAVVRSLAQAELETLARQIAGSNFLLAFADADGVILDLCADNRFAMSGAQAGILPGSCWSEQLCGTNGLGTALASGRPTAVTGMEHYLLRLGDISCTASPVRDALGEIVGVLDASSYFEGRQRHTQALVQMAATHIENGLLVRQMHEHLVLAIHPRPEFLVTLSAGLLAFDIGGRLVALNARARQLLQGLEPVAGSRFDQLFGEGFEQVLTRLQRGGHLRLRDLLGSALAAACVSRPPPPRHAPDWGLAQSRPAAAPSAQAGAALSHRTLAPRPAASATPPAGEDPRLAAARRRVAAAVALKVPVLIHGETGSGKEVLARHAHTASGRRGEFVAINCGGVPAELFEAELFGYAGGAFTGARREGHAGLLASADGGTLLLDEIAELPLRLQATLLRFLDDQMLRPVGGTRPRQVDVQVLAATNASLEEAVAAQRFRADLFFRLDTVRIELPPLRERQDFDTAAHELLASLDPQARLTAAALHRLAQHRWPGNFRELRAVLTRALLEGGGRMLDAQDFEPLLPPVAGDEPAAWPAARGEGSAPVSALRLGASDLVRREFERSGRSVSRTSRSLGISRTTVYRHLRDTPSK